MQEQVHAEGLQPVEQTCGEREKCEEDGAIERSCYRLIATPSCPVLLQVGESRAVGG